MANTPPKTPQLEKLLKAMGATFTAFRKLFGYGSGEKFANSRNINRSQYGKYEAGSTDMRIGSLIEIAAEFGLREEDIFKKEFLNAGKESNEINLKVIDHIRSQVRNQVQRQKGIAVSDEIIDRTVVIINYCDQPRSRESILKKIGLSNSSKNFSRNIGLAINEGWIGMTIPDKPNSSNQRYIVTDKGKNVLKSKPENQF